MTVIYSRILYLGLMILIGFVCEKAGYVDKICDRVGKLIKNITLPALVLTSVTGQEIEKRIVGEAAIIVVMAFAAMAFLAVAGVAAARVFKLGERQRPVHIGDLWKRCFFVLSFGSGGFRRYGYLLCRVLRNCQ